MMPHKSALIPPSSKQGWKDWMVGAPGFEPGPDDPFPCVASHCSDGNPSPFVDVGPGLLALLIIAAPKWLRRAKDRSSQETRTLIDGLKAAREGQALSSHGRAGAGPRRPREPQEDQDLWQGLHRHPLMTIAYAFCNILASHRRGGKKQINGPPPQPSLPAVRTPSSISFFERQLADAHTSDDEPVKGRSR